MTWETRLFAIQESEYDPVFWVFAGTCDLLILWWALVFLSIGWMVFYINKLRYQKSTAVLSPPLTLFALSSAATLLLLLVLFWRHL